MNNFTDEGDWPEDSDGWTAEQHWLVACKLLDSNHEVTNGEAGTTSTVEYRHYVSKSRDDHPSDPAELAPYLAAIAHAILALGAPASS